MTAPDGMAQLIVEAGFAPAAPGLSSGVLILDDPVAGLLDTGTLADDDTWTDISAPLAQSLTVTRSSTREQGPVITYEGGTAVVTLDNSDARFTPENLAGPYVAAGVTQVRAMIPVRARAIWDGVSYPLFRGFAQSWDPGEDMGPDYAVTTLTAADGFLILAGVTLPATGATGAGELSGARVQRILAAAGWYDAARGLSAVSAGQSAMQATTLGAAALDLLQLTAASEIGSLYVDETGSLTFRGRHDVLTDPRSATVQAVFGDRPGTIAPGAATAAYLNSDPGFESGISGWTAGHGATLGYGTDYQYGPAPGVMSIHGDGVTANPRGLSPTVTGITALATYTIFLVTYTPVATGMQLQVDWKTSGGVFISSSLSAVVTTSSPWQVLSVTDAAPATAAQATVIPTMTGTPAASVMGYAGWWSVIAGDASSAPAEMYYSAVTVPPADLSLANDIQATRAGGTLQEVTGAASVSRYLFKRTYSRSDLILTSDGEALNWAQYVAWITAGTPEFDSITLIPAADPDNLWPLALGLQMGDRVQVWRRPPGMTASPIARDCLIRGITHTVTAGEWTTVLTLQDASRYSFFTLDSPALGKLGASALAF